jgi:hypothetical protein
VDLMRARLALRERRLVDVLDLAIRFCAAHAGPYAKLSLFVLLPAFSASCAVAWAAGWWIGWMSAGVMWALADAPFVSLASRLVFDEEVEIGEAIRAALRAVPRLVAARLLQMLALACCALMAGLPWLWAGTATLFVTEIVVLERASVGVAFRRAQRIARAHFGVAMVAMVVLFLLPIGAALVADVAGREVLGEVLEIKSPPSVFTAGGSVLALLGAWASLPLLTTARFFVYLDVRTRTEGWDVQTRFAAIAARAQASPT